MTPPPETRTALPPALVPEDRAMLRVYAPDSRLRQASRPVGLLDILNAVGSGTCTASLIAEDLLLTNAHCAEEGVRAYRFFPEYFDEGDTGLNTGGMGAYAPLPWAPADLTEQVVREVAQPVIAEMHRRGTPFAGLLYAGLALTSRGLRVIEFNARFGDPETQVILPRLKTDLVTIANACIDEIGRAHV